LTFGTPLLIFLYHAEIVLDEEVDGRMRIGFAHFVSWIERYVRCGPAAQSLDGRKPFAFPIKSASSITSTGEGGATCRAEYGASFESAAFDVVAP
jgi:hypothetical protein